MANTAALGGFVPGAGTTFGGFAPGVGTVGTTVSVPTPGVLTVPGVGTVTGLNGGFVGPNGNLVGFNGNLVNGNVLGTTGVVGVNPLTGGPVVVAPGTASPLLLNALQNAALQNNVFGQRFQTRSSRNALRGSRTAVARNLGVSRVGRTAAGVNAVVGSNLNTLGFTGGRPVTLSGELQNAQGFFNGASVVPTLQGTPISNVAATNLSGASLGQALNSPAGGLGIPATLTGFGGVVPTVGRGGNVAPGVVVPSRGRAINAFGIPQTVTGRSTVVVPSRTRGAGAFTGLNSGVTGASFDNFGTGIANLTTTGGAVGSTRGFGTAAQPGIDTGTALVGANQVGLTGNTLPAVNPAAAGVGAIQSTLPFQTATTATGLTNAGGLSNLMFLQTASGPVLVANPLGLPVSPGVNNLQLQGQLFRRGPFRLLVLDNASALQAAGVNNLNVTGDIP